jgi:hypothetical protein
MLHPDQGSELDHSGSISDAGNRGTDPPGDHRASAQRRINLVATMPSRNRSPPSSPRQVRVGNVATEIAGQPEGSRLDMEVSRRSE